MVVLKIILSHINFIFNIVCINVFLLIIVRSNIPRLPDFPHHSKISIIVYYIMLSLLRAPEGWLNFFLNLCLIKIVTYIILYFLGKCYARGFPWRSWCYIPLVQLSLLGGSYFLIFLWLDQVYIFHLNIFFFINFGNVLCKQI